MIGSGLLEKANAGWNARHGGVIGSRRHANDAGPDQSIPPPTATKADVRAGYDGASVTRRTAGWLAPSTGPNTEGLRGLVTLRNRHRDLIRNNAWAFRAKQAITNSMVGSGIMASHASKGMMSTWKRWAETRECDADGRLDFYGIQSLAAGAVVESGEVLIRRRWRTLTDGLTVPLQVQVLESDFLDHTKTEELPNGNVILQGVEFNRIGKRVGYWLYNQHPGDWAATGTMDLVSKRYPAEDIIHVYRLDRPGMVRGVPWGAPAIITLRDLAGINDTYALRQKLAACFVAFVTDTAIPDDVESEYELFDTLKPGAIEILPPGKNMQFANPPGVEGLNDFMKLNLQYAANAYGLPYYIFTGDLSEVNFSSARMGRNEFETNVDAWRWNMLIPLLCDGVWRWFAEAYALTGAKMDLRPANWTPQPHVIVDLKNEIPILLEMLERGLMSEPEFVMRVFGHDPDEVRNEIERVNVIRKGKGLMEFGTPAFIKNQKAAANEQQPQPDQKASA